MSASRALAQVLACPTCRGGLGADLSCAACRRGYALEQGVLRLLPGHGPSNSDVQGFYDKNPFPDYEDLDSPRSLRERAGQSHFARLLDEQLPLDGVTLDAGCGTGQLTNFLALSRRQTVGMDFCLASLGLASGFRDRHGIARATFVQGDLFAPPFRDQSLAAIVSLGVLHHTQDPEGAFRSLVRCLVPGGHFVLGLYNRYARIPTRLRGLLIRLGGRGLFGGLDPVARQDRHNARRRTSWLNDQYFHPLEHTHTVDEVLGWFARAGLEYVNAVPKVVFGEVFTEHEDLFEPGIKGSRADHLLTQAGWAFAHGWEGGLFVLIGRRA
jgi:SAM-dependent methyltransferase